MASRKPSLLQRAEKAIRRLEKAARRVTERRPYVFDLPFRRTKTGGEKTRYTRKEVERLEKMRTKDLYQYAEVPLYNMSGEEYRQYERKQQAKKAATTRKENKLTSERLRIEAEQRREQAELEYRRKVFKSISPTVVDNFINRSNWLFKDEYYLAFKEALQEAIDMTSKDYVAEIIQDMEKSGLVWQVQHGYKPEHFDNLFPKFITFIKERLPLVSERISNLEDEEEYDDDVSIEELARQVTTKDMDEEEREFYEERWGR